MRWCAPLCCTLKGRARSELLVGATVGRYRSPVTRREWFHGGVAVLVVAGLLAVGCSSGKSERDFSDLSGATFRRSCDDGGCEVEVRGSSCGDRASVVGGKWLSVCTGDSAFYAENCRLVRCEVDAQCDFFSGYGCRSGVCEDARFAGPGVALAEDVFAWCFASTSRDEACRTASSPAESPLVSAVRKACPRDRLGCESFPAECPPP